MSDRFEDLRTFVTVVDESGFSAAAERLGLVKSAVSRRVRELEERLGVRLLSRTARTLRLTEAGAAFHERATKILAELEEAEELAGIGAREAVGRLRISAPMSFTINCLAPVLGELLERHPRLELDLDANDRMVDIVAEGFDVAIRITRMRDSTLIARRIAEVRHVTCASPAYLARRGRPRTPTDLATHQGLLYSYVSPRDYWTFRDGEVAELRSALQMNNADAIREAAIAGHGVAFLPTFIVSGAIARGELEVVLADHARPPIAMYAVFPSNRQLSAKVRHLIDFLLERFGADPSWDRAH